MAQKLLIALTLILTSCVGTMMSQSDYEAIAFGETGDSLIAKYGQPYEVKALKGGLVEYHYIMRIPVRSDLSDERHFYFTLNEGKVVSKRVSEVGSSVQLRYQ